MKIDINFGLDDKFLDAKITKAQKTKFYFGRDCSNHGVFQLTCEADGKTYEANLVVILQDREKWEFGRDDIHEVTDEDQRRVFEDCLSKFPAYEGGRELSQDSLNEFVRWIGSGSATARIISRGVYTDRNGDNHLKCDIVKPGNATDSKPAAMKKPSASAPVKPSAPVAPKKPTAPTAPAKPAAPAKVYTSQDAWDAYEGGERIKSDPQGEKFYATCAAIVGRDASTYETWTSADWQKCAETFDMPF